MQAVSTDDEIETSAPAAPQLDLDPFRLLLQANDLLIEDRFNTIADRTVQQARQIASCQSDVTPACEIVEDVRTKSRDTPAAIVDEKGGGEKIRISLTR
ncbi:hypothetical protein ACVWWO_001534 [Bradyrhizobium sp. F1.13.1]